MDARAQDAAGANTLGLDELRNSAERAVAALAGPRLSLVQQPRRPYEHGLLARVMLRLGGQDPHISPPSDVHRCAAVVFGLGLTAVWEVAAVVIAAWYDLNVRQGLWGAVVVGLLVAVTVVVFDWHVIQRHVQGSTGKLVWAVRAVFVVSMVLLVSEAVATAVFDSDIRAEAIQDNAPKLQSLQQQVDKNAQLQAAEDTAVAKLLADVAGAQRDVRTYSAQAQIEDHGYGVLGGKGTKYHLAMLQLSQAQGRLSSATTARDDASTGVAAHRARKQSLQQQAMQLRDALGIVPVDGMGPAQREAKLWTYLLHHPEALVFKRLPLFFVMLTLDLFGLIIGVAVPGRTRRTHQASIDEQLAWLREAYSVRQRIRVEARRHVESLLASAFEGGPSEESGGTAPVTLDLTSQTAVRQPRPGR